MNFLRDQAPTIDDALSLEVHELAFLLLREMQKTGKPQHAGNWFLGLSRLYDPPAHSGDPRPQGRDAFALAVAEAVAWLISKGLITTYYDGNYAHQFVTRRGRTVDTDEAFRLFLFETFLEPSVLHPALQSEAWLLYGHGKFDSAVFEALSGLKSSSGMRAATAPLTTVLR